MGGCTGDERTGTLILVADDDPVLQAIAQEELELAGWRYHGVSNGKDAVRHCIQLEPDIVLMDVQMPGMDGFSACREIRKAGFENLPVLFTTADGDTASIERAYEAGATGFEVKPINWLLMCYRIRYMLRSSRTRVALEAVTNELEATQAVAKLGSWSFDLDTRLFRISAQAAQVLQLGTQPLQSSPDELFARLDLTGRDTPRRQLLELMKGQCVGQFVLPLGASSPENSRAVFVRSDVAANRRVSGYVQDVTDRERAAARIRRLAYVDSVTGLPNQHFFGEMLAHQLMVSRRSGESVAVLHINLDSFRRVNESLGSKRADDVLRSVAVRLNETTRESDVVTLTGPDDAPEGPTARLRGDEFAVLLPGLQHDGCAGIVATRILAALSEPIVAGDSIVSQTASIGIAIGPRDGADAAALMGHAEAAAASAKQRGAGQLCYFDEDMELQMRRRTRMVTALHQALEHDEFYVVYQPKVTLSSGNATAAEALLRWHSPEFGEVSPGEFIPLAEESGLIVRLGTWVLNAALDTMARWQSCGSGLTSVAVNVSAVQFSQTGFADLVANALDARALDPACLELEITESMVAADPQHADTMLHALVAHGISLSIDDFGTGYSSLSQLKNMPVSTLKIDRSFVNDIETDVQARTIASVIAQMGNLLGLTVIAEGVETVGQLEALAATNCDLVQGYLFARPMREPELSQWLQTANSPSVHAPLQHAVLS